jgi:prepilin-type N-terminal cleavage/methylation domain-containing protein
LSPPSTEHRAPSAGAQRPGFTLIELLVVLMALVMVAAAVVPALRGAGHQEDLTGVAARVTASARFAREEAAERQTGIVLTVEPAAVQLTAEDPAATAVPGPVGMTAPGSVDGRSLLPPLPSAFARVLLPSRVHARLETAPEALNAPVPSTPASGGELQSLRFSPDGRTTGGIVVLTDDRGRVLRVVVTPGTGLVQVEPGNG